MASEEFRTGAVYETEAQARLALEAIADLPLAHADITLIEPVASAGDNALDHSGRHFIRQLIQDALPGAGVGAGAGAGIGGLGAALLAAHSPALFISAPILPGLAIAAWGAWLGGVVGAGIALQMQQESLDAALDAASREGHWCLVIHTRRADDHRRVLELLATQPVIEIDEDKARHQ